ncbi:substrate-binding domain-containing protein [Roseivivax sp.]
MPEFLTVRELAELLRIKERKVYDLAASGAVPCAKVTGKLLFPEDEVRAWIAGGRSGPAPERPAPPPVFLGSHDPLLEWALRQSGAGLATLFDGSGAGLRRFLRGEGLAAGLHLPGPGGRWNIPAVEAEAARTDAVLIAFARRQRGLILRPGMAKGTRGLEALPDLWIAPRPETTGSEKLFATLLAEAGLDPARLMRTGTAQSEEDAVFAVKHEEADTTFGLEALARTHGLDFLPLAEERFDLLVDRRAAFEPPLQALFEVMRSEAFRAHAGQLAGYDVREAGTVRWNA